MGTPCIPSHQPRTAAMGDKGKKEGKGKKPAEETGSYGRGTPRKGVVLSTVSILVLVPTVCGCRLVPRRGRGYAMSTMRTS